MRKSLGVVRTTIIGGLLFMLPFAVVVFLIGQVSFLIYPAVVKVQEFLPAAAFSFGFVSSATLLATLIVLALCYLAGLAAQRSLAARFSAKIEKSLLLLFPRYAIWKNEMASNLGGAATGNAAMKPVLVTLDDAVQIGFETDREPCGPVTVYLPSAPDPWSGRLVHVSSERVAPLAADFGQALAVFETLGRQANRVLASHPPAPPAASATTPSK
jgi:uncharacterized membrane protein